MIYAHGLIGCEEQHLIDLLREDPCVSHRHEPLAKSRTAQFLQNDVCRQGSWVHAFCPHLDHPAILFDDVVVRWKSQAQSATSTIHASMLLSVIGGIHFHQGKLNEALYYAREALRIHEDKNDTAAASLWCNVGFLLHILGRDIEDAIYALSYSFQILSRAMQSTTDRQQRDKTTVQVLLLRAIACHEGSHDQYLLSFLNNLIETRASLGCDHPKTVKLLQYLGEHFLEQGMFEPAETFLLEAVRVLRMTGSANEAELILSLSKLGYYYQRVGNAFEALSSYKEALCVRKLPIHNESNEIKRILSTVFYNIGTIHSLQSQDKSKTLSYRANHREISLQLFQLCLQLRKSCYGSDHPCLGNVLYNIGVMVLESGDTEHALAYFEESLKVWSTNHESYQGGMVSSLQYLAYIYKSKGEYNCAIEYFSRAVETLDRHSSCSDSTYLRIEVLVGLAQMHHIIGFHDQALNSYEEAAQLLRDCTQLSSEEGVCRMVGLLIAMGNLATDLSDVDAACSFYTEAASLDLDSGNRQSRIGGQWSEFSENAYPGHAAAA